MPNKELHLVVKTALNTEDLDNVQYSIPQKLPDCLLIKQWFLSLHACPRIIFDVDQSFVQYARVYDIEKSSTMVVLIFFICVLHIRPLFKVVNKCYASKKYIDHSFFRFPFFEFEESVSRYCWLYLIAKNLMKNGKCFNLHFWLHLNTSYLTPSIHMYIFSTYLNPICFLKNAATF